ncbi:long-chain-fatty-acid--CoA ligase [Rhodococcus jostii]|uniref:long-chain-fatty-acid--CoA ligase n=1 Tax=Rhodococcus jostii TaxID=132919 RepID=UPI0036442914
MSEPNVTALTPLAFLDRAAKTFPGKTAIVLGGRRATYSEFAAEAAALARGLARLGVGEQDRVAYLAPNVPELLVAHFGVPLSKGVLVALNTRLASAEIAYILAHCDAKILVVHESLLDSIRPIAGELRLSTVVVIGAGDIAGVDAVEYRKILDHNAHEPIDWTVRDELATISINYTSGTTGRPKGVMYTHRGAYLNAMGELIHSRHTSGSVYLWTLPMFHCNGWCTPWAITAIGGTHICLEAIDSEKIWTLFRTEGGSHFNAAPTVLVMLVNSPSAAALPQAVTVTTAGAPPSPTIIEQARVLGFEIIHVYGLTETYGPYSVCETQSDWAELPATEQARLAARQGVGMIHTDGVRVVDKYMTDVPADGSTIGEIVMRGNGVMKGYLNDPAATEKAFEGGWFHSGDLGVMHPDGYVELRDRSKDIVISGGENISSVEVEQVLVSHPAVLEAAVIGVPSEKWGERPKAFVVTKPNAQVTPDELRSHAATRMAKFKVPDVIDVIDALPKTSTGKIQKFQLRDREWSGHHTRIQG